MKVPAKASVWQISTQEISGEIVIILVATLEMASGDYMVEEERVIGQEKAARRRKSGTVLRETAEVAPGRPQGAGSKVSRVEGLELGELTDSIRTRKYL